MKLYIGADHRGFELKEKIKSWLSSKELEVIDCGSTVYDKTDDFTDHSFAVAQKVADSSRELTFRDEPLAFGIVICGSGGGVTISANKVKNIRCAQGINSEDVAHNRKHDNINVLAIGSDFVSEKEAVSMVEVFLTTRFLSEDRLIRRLQKISDFENSSFK